jgi:hypothetical protein
MLDLFLLTREDLLQALLQALYHATTKEMARYGQREQREAKISKQKKKIRHKTESRRKDMILD